jgi:AraC family transcriptional regulator
LTVILREMPAIRDEGFRKWFYARWGRENCIILALTQAAEYPLYTQRLSLKAAWGGCEDYYIDGRRVAVDDDTFMILNDGRTYGSRIKNPAPVKSFSIFFRPGMAEEVARTLLAPPERLLEQTAESRMSPQFSEHVRRHDRVITPILRFIGHHVEEGIDDEQWYEEQLYFLLTRMSATHLRDGTAAQLIPARRASTRKELYRRVGLAVDFINTHYAEPIDLSRIAAAASLSPYHCLRIFKSVHGRTPTGYLNEKRMQVAQRLLHDRERPVEAVAAELGFQSRTTLFRHMKSTLGAAPSHFRHPDKKRTPKIAGRQRPLPRARRLLPE